MESKLEILQNNLDNKIAEITLKLDKEIFSKIDEVLNKKNLPIDYSKIQRVQVISGLSNFVNNLEKYDLLYSGAKFLSYSIKFDNILMDNLTFLITTNVNFEEYGE